MLLSYKKKKNVRTCFEKKYCFLYKTVSYVEDRIIYYQELHVSSIKYQTTETISLTRTEQYHTSIPYLCAHHFNPIEILI